MIYTLIYFEDLQTINLCLIPEKMNSYAKDPGQTSLLKMSKVVFRPIGPDPKLFTHSLVAPTPPPYPRSQFRVAVVEAVHLINEQVRAAQIPQSNPLSPREVIECTSPSGL